MRQQVTTKGTMKLICPYCYSEYEEESFLELDEGYTDCEVCDREFRYSREYNPVYSSKKLLCEELGEECEHEKIVIDSFGNTKYKCKKCDDETNIKLVKQENILFRHAK